jgi:hypothetical protein
MQNKKLFSASIAAVAMICLVLATPSVWAQGSHSGGGKGGGGHESGSTNHDDGCESDACGDDHDSSHEGGKKGAGAGGKGRLGAGAGRGGGHQSLRDVFKELEDEVHSDEKGPPAGKGKASSTSGAR